MAAQFLRLFEGHPDRGGIAALARCTPQHQNIDTPIGLAVRAQRARDPARRMFGVPRFEPRPTPFSSSATMALVTLSYTSAFIAFFLWSAGCACNRLATRQ